MCLTDWQRYVLSISHILLQKYFLAISSPGHRLPRNCSDVNDYPDRNQYKYRRDFTFQYARGAVFKGRQWFVFTRKGSKCTMRNI